MESQDLIGDPKTVHDNCMLNCVMAIILDHSWENVGGVYKYAFCLIDCTLLIQYLLLQLVHECIYRFYCYCECEVLEDGSIYLFSFCRLSHGVSVLIVLFLLCHKIYDGAFRFDQVVTAFRHLYLTFHNNRHRPYLAFYFHNSC